VLRLAIILLVAPFAAEAIYRAVLFVGRGALPPRGAVFDIYAVGESTMRGPHPAEDPIPAGRSDVREPHRGS
jgi:hypothetical protein